MSERGGKGVVRAAAAQCRARALSRLLPRSRQYSKTRSRRLAAHRPNRNARAGARARELSRPGAAWCARTVSSVDKESFANEERVLYFAPGILGLFTPIRG